MLEPQKGVAGTSVGVEATEEAAVTEGHTASRGFTSRGAKPAVSPLTEGVRHPSASDRAYGQPLHAGTETASGGATTGETKAGSPLSPAGHGSHEIKIELGEGTVTGGITATLEYGKTGVPLGADQLKAFETTSSIQLNGLVARMETAFLNGELEADVFEGLKVSIEANAITAGVNTEGEADVDLVSVGVKLTGDAGHLLKLPPGMTFTIDGRLSIALGGKLAAKLASYTMAQLEQRMLVQEMDDIGELADDAARKVKDLESKASLLDAQGSHQAAAKLREEALEQRGRVGAAKKQLDGLTGKLRAAKHKTDRAIAKLQGKLAKQVAKAMEKKAVKFIATRLMKLVPVLNLVSTILDAVELVGFIKNLIEGDFGGGGGGGDGDRADKQGAESSTSTAAGTTDHAGQDGTTADASGTSPSDPEKQAARDTVRGQLSSAARALVDAMTRPAGAGPTLDADQLGMIGLLVPADLSADELTQVLTELRTSQGKANTAEEVIEAIDTAVRGIRNRDRTIKVNGELRTDLGDDTTGADRETATERASSSSEPITSPAQVSGSMRALEIVQSGDVATIAHWFVVEGNSLVWSARGKEWKQRHERSIVGPDTSLSSVNAHIESAGATHWSLRLQFTLTIDGKQLSHSHDFGVSTVPPASTNDYVVGGLTFAPLLMLGNAR